ncbi:Flp pilus assembly protein CpaB [Candidatus Viridilinea mediisalina]|uniref:Flp pilus assembly protein CpaB n=1 Tax=Candidatus Viridilinea mediisalina TaxID=2024553 RepID=A0A2A6RPN3_9CHLR|nr:Flp pilus assembly protein CpaB [Candidatus Viridilinea mediisalina]PDW04829.1 Flp pilus assembly protein CpaB [Candidatus Viridilinea mediisalina]
MRRGGILILLIGLILIVGAGGLFLFMQTSGGISPLEPGDFDLAELAAEPTEIPGVEIVVARAPIAAGVIITDTVSLLRLDEIDHNLFNADRNVQSVLDVQGMILLQPVGPGDPILQSNLTEPGLAQRIPPAEGNRPRHKAYPLVVNNLTGVANQVKENDFVDVVVTFVVPRTISRVVPRDPDAPPEMQMPPQAAFDTQLMVSTKTIVQGAQVLQILRPPVTVDPTPEGQAAGGGVQVDDSGAVIGPGADLEAAGGTITQGTWTVLLALNAQEAELLEFAQTSDARIVLVLRGAGDTDFEPTIGASLDLLMDEFALPLPEPPPFYVVSPDEQLTPVPTRTPAPTRVP